MDIAVYTHQFIDYIDERGKDPGLVETLGRGRKPFPYGPRERIVPFQRVVAR